MIPVFRPLKDRAVAIVWSGLAASTIGEDLFRVAVVWIAADQIGNAAGYVNAAQVAELTADGFTKIEFRYLRKTRVFIHPL